MRNLILSHQESSITTIPDEVLLTTQPESNTNTKSPDLQYSITLCNDNYIILFSNGTIIKTSNNDTNSMNIILNHNNEDNNNENNILASLSNDEVWFNIEYIEENNTLVCLSYNGSIVQLQLQEEDLAVEDITNVGKFDNGILAGKWNTPNNDLLLLCIPSVTNNGISILCMNYEFDIISESNELENYTREYVDIVWKPNEKDFYISAVDQTDSLRKLLFFNVTNLDIMYTSRSEDGNGTMIPNLLHAIGCWSNSNKNSILYCVQLKKKPKLISFESNGLRHSVNDINLNQIPSDDGTINVIDIQWNLTCDILAISFGSKDDYGIVFFTRDNYHWYCKYKLNYEVRPCIMFSLEQANEFHVFLVHDKVEAYKYVFIWDIIRMDASIGVIDGKYLNVSKWDREIVPPPMYSLQLRYDDCVIGVASSPSALISFLVILSNNTFIFMNKEYKIVLEMKIDNLVSQLRHVTILQSTSNVIKIGAIHYNTMMKQDELLIYTIEVLEGSNDNYTGTILECKNYTLEQSILRVLPYNATDGTNLILEYVNGNLLHYNTNEEMIDPTYFNYSLPEPCSYLSSYNTNPHPIVFGLSKSQIRLYCQDILLSSSTQYITSFYTNTNYFIYCTTSSSIGILYFIPIHKITSFIANQDTLMMLENDLHQEITSSTQTRNVERGSYILSLQSTKVILQIQPRGNIEILYPTSLTIPYCYNLTLHKKFLQAFVCMRKWKIDFNLLVDVHPFNVLEVFVNQLVESRLKDTQCIDYLNLFIATLDNSDCTKNKYCDILSNIHTTNLEFDWSDKVNTMCSELRTILFKLHKTKNITTYIPCILSTYAKQSPPDLKSALLYLQSSEKNESHIPYLAFLSTYQEIYNTALSIYDYDMAYTIARYAPDMDPKMYVKELKVWKNESNAEYAKYLVDVKLENWESGLRHFVLAKTDQGVMIEKDFDSCLLFIKDHELYSLGLSLFLNQQGYRNTILYEFANSLLASASSSRSKYDCKKIAINLYLSANPPFVNEARLTAKNCNEWNTYFRLCFCNKTNDDEYNEIINKEISNILDELSAYNKNTMSTSIISSRKDKVYICQQILLHYPTNTSFYSKCFRVYLSIQEWDHALHLLHSPHGKDAIDTIDKMIHEYKDAIVSYIQTSQDDLMERKEKLQVSMKRFCIVYKKQKDISQERLLEEQQIEFDDSQSLYSTASSQAGSMLSTTSYNSMISANTTSSKTNTIVSHNTVISTQTTASTSTSNTQFTLTSSTQDKHKSKFNKIGRGKPKKKKLNTNTRKSTKVKPGSLEELHSLLGTIQSCCCIDDEYYDTLYKTVLLFIQSSSNVYYDHNVSKIADDSSRNRMMDLAKELLDTYESLRKKWMGLQSLFLEEIDGGTEEAVRVGDDVEEKIKKVFINELPNLLHDTFTLLNV